MPHTNTGARDHSVLKEIRARAGYLIEYRIGEWKDTEGKARNREIAMYQE